MGISALLGMCTKFSEVTLAVHYRERNEKGEWLKRIEAGHYDEADEEELKAVLSEMQV